MNARVRILVVDDDADIRQLLRELLERIGYAVDEAEDGKTALRRLFANAPSLVILDVTMPELDGYQTLERIRDLSDVPVLMLTARRRSSRRFAACQREPTITSRSRSAVRNCSPASRRSCAGPAASRR